MDFSFNCEGGGKGKEINISYLSSEGSPFKNQIAPIFHCLHKSKARNDNLMSSGSACLCSYG